MPSLVIEPYISTLFVLIDTTKHYKQLQTPSPPTLHIVTTHSSMQTHIIINPHKIHYHHGYYLATIFCHAANVWHTLDQIFFASKANHLSTILHSPLLLDSPYNSWNIVQWQILEHCHYWKTLKVRHLASPSSSTRLNTLPIITIIADICETINNSVAHFLDLDIPSQKIQYLMTTISLNPIRYLTCIILTNVTLKKQQHVPLDYPNIF